MTNFEYPSRMADAATEGFLRRFVEKLNAELSAMDRKSTEEADALAKQVRELSQMPTQLRETVAQHGDYIRELQSGIASVNKGLTSINLQLANIRNEIKAVRDLAQMGYNKAIDLGYRVDALEDAVGITSE